MFIETVETPNPLTLKFVPGEDVAQNGTYSFVDKKSAKASPLAESLFTIDGVDGVFFGKDFITISKAEEKPWDILKPDILTIIADHYVSEKPLLYSSYENKKETDYEDDDDIVATIRELIDTRVRPAVAEDGGDIIFHGFQDGIVLLEMHGACAGCPSSTFTLKEGIENMLKHYVPEVIAVEAVDPYFD